MDNKEVIKQHLNTIISNGFSAIKTDTRTNVSDGSYAESVKAIVKRKLGKKLYTGDLRDLAQDALSDVITKALSANESGTSKSLSKASALSDVEAYVRRGIENYCNTRLERWSDNRRPSKDKSDEESGKSAPRARIPITDGGDHMASFWDSKIESDFDTDYVDNENVLGILKVKGLSKEEIEIIQLRLAGESFAEMSRKLGQSSDKYKKIFDRAIKKAGLESIKGFV